VGLLFHALADGLDPAMTSTGRIVTDGAIMRIIDTRVGEKRRVGLSDQSGGGDSTTFASCSAINRM
jgi:hypothetical protein